MSSSTRLIKRRIKSSQNIAQITKAMEMVAASKMKRAQEIALASRPYSHKMAEIITQLSEKAQHQVNHFLLKDPRPHWKPDQPFNVFILVYSTEKSLCGGLNTNLFRGLEKWLKDFKDNYHLPLKTKINFVTVGRKAKEFVLKSNRFLLAEFPQFGDRPHFQDIIPISKMVIDGFKAKKFQMAFITYMEFISTISQKLAVRQLLPIESKQLLKFFDEEASAASPAGSTDENISADYLFEPKPADIFEELLPQYIELQLYHALLESLASEHSARMVAMKNANENALDIVNDLTLEFNQARQAKITNELLEAVSARMAIE